MKLRRRIVWIGAIVLALAAAGYFLYTTYSYTHKAADILEETDVKGGLIAHVGFDDGKLTSAFHANDRYIVHGLSRDMEKIRSAREYLRKKDLYGEVTVQQWRSKTLPYSDNLVNLLVVEDTDEVSREEMMRVLSPEGLAYVNQNGEWTQWVKPRPDSIDKWSHYLHGPSNNPVANDSAVGPPRRLRWKSDPMWCRSHEFLSSFPVMVSDGKRVFYVFDDGLTGVTRDEVPQNWTLYGRDAYSGVRLWKRSLKNWNEPGDSSYVTSLRGVPSKMQRTLVAGDDLLFTTIDYHGPIEMLDPATGQTIKTLKGTEGTEELLYSNGILYARINPKPTEGTPRIIAADPDAGEIMWEQETENYNSNSLAVSNGNVVYSTDHHLVCLSAEEGAQQWKTESEHLEDYSWSAGPTVIINDRTVLIKHNDVTEMRDLSTGEVIWENRAPLKDSPLRASDVFVIDSLVWHSNTGEIAGYSLGSGKKIKSFKPDSIFSEGHHLRCYGAKATGNYILPQYRGLEFVGLDDQPHVQNDWTRGPCRYGVMPSNGLVYVPPHPCFCYAGAMRKGLNAYSTASSGEIENEVAGYRDTADRLVRGPAWQKTTEEAGEDKSLSWPMYRHDHRRSGATETKVEGKLTREWQVKIGENLTSPVASGGKAYVSAKDRNTVYAMDIQKGEVLWRRSVGGQVDSPPTLYEGKVIFGSADGWVYCLRSGDGKLVWRFRAAPSPRMMMHKNRIESPWRVHGSPLLHKGKVYVTAGRNSFLDGGIFLYSLDPDTGEMLHSTRLDTWMRTRKDAEDEPFLPAFHIEGARSDILVSEGGYIYLGQMKFTPELEKLDPPYRKGPDSYETDRGSPDAYGPIVQGDPVSKNPEYEFVHKETIEQYPKFAQRWYRRGHMGAREVGKHLFATGGFLDDSYFNRIYWMYSDTWPGYYMGNVASKTGQLLVMGPEKTYGVNAYNERVVLSPELTPGNTNYLLFADDNDNEPVLTQENWGRDKGMGFSRSQAPEWFDWVPVRVKGMVLAGERLFMAGPPDVIDPEDPMAAFEGRKGGRLWSYDAQSGKPTGKYSLSRPPVFDGMIASEGRILISTTDGSLQCLKGEINP